MSLSSTISKAVDVAFVAVGDLKRSCIVTVYDQSSEPVRDPNTGKLTFGNSETYEGDIIVVQFESKEDRANIESGDLRGIMKQSQIPSLNVADIVTFDGKDHAVLAIFPDPSNSIWECQLRRRG